MANYYAIGRTNYFAVKDAELFKKKIAPIVESNCGEIWEEQQNGQTVYAIGFGEDSGFPSSFYDEESGDDVYEIEWEYLLAEHLADGWVCIIQEIGWEKLRYLTGYAVAFDNTGKRVGVNIGNITDLAKQTFTGTITLPEY